MKNLFGQPQLNWSEILEQAPDKPNNRNAVLLAFSGGNDSRTLAHVVKSWFDNSSYNLELAAIDTELSIEGWHKSVEEYAEWINLPIKFWKGEGKSFYGEFVKKNGFPGNALHYIIQNRLKGRAFKKMVYDRRGEVRGTVWILSGIRKYESRRRQRLTSPYSEREGALFINPIFYWTNAQVVDYMIDNQIPFAPGKQWDCKCGATVRDAETEWAEIKNTSPNLYKYLLNLENPKPWVWGKFDISTYNKLEEIQAGQLQMWNDDGSIEDFPVCQDCWRSAAADEMSLLSDW